VDPALTWIAYRVREVEELLSPVERESVRRWASSNAGQAGVRGRTFEAPVLTGALAASPATGRLENPRRFT